MELVSIALLTYNRAFCVSKAIISVLNQTYKNIELIISDDNSSDNTKDIVNDLIKNDSRAKYIRRSGIGMTQNFVESFKNSKGNYFMWLCDDDYIDNDYIEKAIKELKKDNELSLVCGNTRFFNSNGILERKEFIYLLQKNRIERACNYLKNVNSNIILYGLMRKEQIQKVVYPDTFGADLLWSFQIAFLGKIKILENTNFYYSIEGISQETKNLHNYYKDTKGKIINPYKVLRYNAAKLILNKRGVFSELSYFQKLIFASKVWLILRERFCMPKLEAKIRGNLRIRTRLKHLLGNAKNSFGFS